MEKWLMALFFLMTCLAVGMLVAFLTKQSGDGSGQCTKTGGTSPFSTGMTPANGKATSSPPATTTPAPGPPTASTDPALVNLYDLTVKEDPRRAEEIRNWFLQFTTPSTGDAPDLFSTPERIRQNLRNLTSHMHPAGTAENWRVSQLIHDTWKSQGLDEVKFFEYDNVLLSYPNWDEPAKVWVYQDGNWTVVSNGTARPVGPPEAQAEQQDPRAPVWWNAYSSNGTATAPVVYANYGSIKDYAYLESLGISIAGKIVLVRYGGLWRGSKVYEAERRNASGVIIFTDPSDYGPPQNASGWVFPDSIYMPPQGAQRGSIFQGDGDPLTPLYPAKNYTFRTTSEEELKQELMIAVIPVMPMGYGDAREILGLLDGLSAPKDWQGGLNLTYKVNGSLDFKMTVNTYNRPATIRNVLGFLRGGEEPDRYVILGNHIDAWTFGGQDPNSGTAVNLELTRVFMSIVNATGWRPRRTIVFAGWDAEEYGLVGSTEFTEELLKLLEYRAVAYINVDIAVKGNLSLEADSVPLLYRALVEAARHVPNPNPAEVAAGRSTVLDSFLYWNWNNDSSLPYMGIPGAGSDQEHFLVFVGMPVIDMSYRCEPQHCYKLYHSMYELAWTVENLVDKDFAFHTAMLRLWGELARSLADSVLIPFNVTDYAVQIDSYLRQMDNQLRQKGMNATIPNYETVIGNLMDASGRFAGTAAGLQSVMDGVNAGAEISLRRAEAINSRLVQLERAFIEPQGLPGRPGIRHVVFAPSLHDSYEGVAFAGVSDSVEYYNEATDPLARQYWLKTVQTQLSVVQYSLESAILLLDGAAVN